MYKYRNGTNTIATLTANFWGIGCIFFSDLLKIYSSISNIVQRLVFFWKFDVVDGKIAYAAAPSLQWPDHVTIRVAGRSYIGEWSVDNSEI